MSIEKKFKALNEEIARLEKEALEMRDMASQIRQTKLNMIMTLPIKDAVYWYIREYGAVEYKDMRYYSPFEKHPEGRSASLNAIDELLKEGRLVPGYHPGTIGAVK